MLKYFFTVITQIKFIIILISNKCKNTKSSKKINVKKVNRKRKKLY